MAGEQMTRSQLEEAAGWFDQMAGCIQASTARNLLASVIRCREQVGTPVGGSHPVADANTITGLTAAVFIASNSQRDRTHNVTATAFRATALNFRRSGE